jgi:hypothetical protein
MGVVDQEKGAAVLCLHWRFPMALVSLQQTDGYHDAEQSRLPSS